MILQALLIALAVALLVAWFIVYRQHNLLKNYNAALGTINLPLSLFDESGKCLYINNATKKLLSTSENENHTSLLARAQAQYDPIPSIGNSGHRSLVITNEADLQKAINSKDQEIYWLSFILDALPTPLSVTDNDMKWTFVNKAVEEMLGMKRADVLGKHCSSWGANICGTSACGVECLRKGKNDTGFTQSGNDYSVTPITCMTKTAKLLAM